MDDQGHTMIVVRFQQTFPLRIAEWLMSAILIGWGVILALNSDVFARSPAMVELAHNAPQGYWAVGMLALGLMRFAMLVVNGAWRASPHLRALGAFLTCFVWLQISFGLARSGVPNVGLAVYPWFLLLDTYNVFRAMSDARVADDRAKGVHSGA